MRPNTFDSVDFLNFSFEHACTEFYAHYYAAHPQHPIVVQGLCIYAQKVPPHFAEKPRLLPNVSLEQQGLVAAEVAAPDTAPAALAVFVLHLLRFEAKVCRLFLDIIHAHLNARLAAEKYLTEYDNIKIMIAETATDLILVNQALELKNTQEYCHSLIKHSLNRLMKLSGGRAYLAGSVIDLLNVFETFNTLYLARTS